MSRDRREKLKARFDDPEYRHSYSNAYQNTHIATQIRVLRKKKKWNQIQLAEQAGMKQSQISAFEDVNHASWSASSLRKIAKALDLRLVISFEEYGPLLLEAHRFSLEALDRRSFSDDPVFKETESIVLRSEVDNYETGVTFCFAKFEQSAGVGSYRVKKSTAQTPHFDLMDASDNDERYFSS